MSVWRQTGQRPKELDDILELPENLYYMWKIFIDLHNTRSAGMAENAITYTEIKAYADLFNINFEEWEIMLLCKFDRTYLEVRSEIAEKENKKKQSK